MFVLSSLLFSPFLLIAILQKYARKHSVAMDTLSFQSEILEYYEESDLANIHQHINRTVRSNSNSSSSNNNNNAESSTTAANSNSNSNINNEDTYLIKGLYLEAANWHIHDRLLKESKPKELYTRMPIVSFSYKSLFTSFYPILSYSNPSLFISLDQMVDFVD